MRSFRCQVCGAQLFFENSICVNCKTGVGYSREHRTLVPLQPDGSYLSPASDQQHVCANLNLNGCTWLAPAHLRFCFSCSLTRTRPADHDRAGLAAYYIAEAAKRRLVFELDELGLPIAPSSAPGGLAFDLLSSARQRVITGHENGVITFDLAESNDVHREGLRISMDEPYRTVLGHFRHEIGHYYWEVLISGTDRLPGFRTMFGDESLPYQESIDRHYSLGAPPDWQETFISKYATMHPWEDFAEVFAHYLHIVDALQTAVECGVLPLGGEDGSDRDGRSFAAVIAGDWLPLASAMNQINRSMGKSDLYPFVLAGLVINKLSFIDELVTSQA